MAKTSVKLCREIWRNATYAARSSIIYDKTVPQLVMLDIRWHWDKLNDDERLSDTVDVPDMVLSSVDKIYEQETIREKVRVRSRGDA